MEYEARWPILDPAQPTSALIAEADAALIRMLDDAGLTAVGRVCWMRLDDGHLTGRVAVEPDVPPVAGEPPHASRAAWLADLLDDRPEPGAAVVELWRAPALPRAVSVP